MKKWILELDRLLRGEATRLPSLQQGTIQIPSGGLSILIVLLGCAYGMCMGSFALFIEKGPVWEQFLATTLKVPALFFLTLFITLPSLYVFNALVGSRLNFLSVWRLLIAALAVNLTVVASLGPIVAFFSASTKSYSFMVLLNVLMLSIAGFLGLSFLRQTLHRLSLPSTPAPPIPPPVPLAERPSLSPAPGQLIQSGPLDRVEGHLLGSHVKSIFRCWIVIFALVGAQMGWVLRPFLGDPTQPFTWFRPRGSNFFEAVWKHFLNLFS